MKTTVSKGRSAKGPKQQSLAPSVLSMDAQHHGGRLQNGRSAAILGPVLQHLEGGRVWHSPCWSSTHYVEGDDLELLVLSCFYPPTAEISAMHHHAKYMQC